MIYQKGILGKWTFGPEVRYFLVDVRSCLLVWAYARLGGCTLLSFSADIRYFLVDVCQRTI
jgi:hypothetical protein